MVNDRLLEKRIPFNIIVPVGGRVQACWACRASSCGAGQRKAWYNNGPGGWSGDFRAAEMVLSPASPKDSGGVFAMMNPATIALIAIVVLLLLVLLTVVGIYNRLVALRNRYKNAFSQIDVQLKRRYDLIPNLVEVAKGYIKHERETLEAVIKARNVASAAGQQAARNPGDPAAMTALGGGRRAVDRRAGPAVRRGRGLSRPEGQPEHAGPARGTFLDGEQDRLRPAGLQRRRDDLQHPARGVPQRRYRLDVQFPGGQSVRGRDSPRSGPPRRFRLESSRVASASRLWPATSHQPLLHPTRAIWISSIARTTPGGKPCGCWCCSPWRWPSLS